ncbi:MAG: addiction module protein [Sphingobacteriales bacterium JAD_PAG50586_3]|nr:MAG: addiction module protein [Sphingobacteriales bacterium JAD_PAG50586_3]
MKPLTIDIKYGKETRTLKYTGELAQEYLLFLLRDLGFDTNDIVDREISEEDKQELKNRVADFKAGKTKAITLEELNKKIAGRKNK